MAEAPSAPAAGSGNPRTAQRRRVGLPRTSQHYLPRPSEPATRLHHFRIDRLPDGSLHELGRGGMGVTYKAFDERLRLPVALKVIAPFREHNTAAQTLFLREARAAARVRHSNVASVLYLNDTPGNLFYAMEFVDGVSLESWLKARGPVPAEAAIPLAEQVARALAAIHAQGIIHRDLKPSNIMLVGSVDAVGPRTVKIIDFGLARPIARTEAGTQSIGFRGTALYASPEQCEEAPNLDGRSDLYSLGCILFQMLTGGPPFTASSHRELMNQHVGAAIPIDRLATIPVDLRSIVARLLAKSPDDRFATADLTIAEFERCRLLLAQRAAQAPSAPPSTTDSHKSWVPHATTSTGRASSEPISLHMSVPEPEPILAPGPLRVTASTPNLTELTLPPLRGPLPPPAPIPMPVGHETDTTPAPPSSRTRRTIVLGATAVFVLGLAVGALSRLRPAGSPAASGAGKADPQSTPAQAAVRAATSAAPAAPRRTVAVLPFANLSGGSETAYFADGMHEDILTNLARVRDLRVISRSSVQGFKPDAPRDLRKIATTLGVGTIVEGSVRRTDNKIRVTTQLVDAFSNDTLWAESFDRELTDATAIQSQIALAIVAALKASLTPGEKTLLTEPPASAQAYEVFARARATLKSTNNTRSELAAAETQLEEAIRIDPTFARAFAQLSFLHTLRYAFGTDRTDGRLAKAFATARRASQLGGVDFVDANIALGSYYFRGLGDFPRALEYFQRVLRIEPQNAEALAAVANIQRRLGHWEEAATSYADAVQVNPLDLNLLYNHANTLRYMRRYPECEAALASWKERAGEHFLYHFVRSDLYLGWKGEIEPLRTATASFTNEGHMEVRIYYQVQVQLFERNHAEARRLVEQSAYNLLEGQQLYVTRDSLLAEIAEQAGERERARAHWQSTLDDVAPLAALRTDCRVLMLHATALAGVGQGEAARAEAERAMQDKKVADDHFDRPAFLWRRALVYLRTGQAGEARRQVDELLRVPGDVTVALLRLDPIWKDLPAPANP